MKTRTFKEWAIERSKRNGKYEKEEIEVRRQFKKGDDNPTEEDIIKTTEALIYKKTLEAVETRIAYIFEDNLLLEVEKSGSKRARLRSLLVDDSLGIEFNSKKQEQLRSSNRNFLMKLLRKTEDKYLGFLKTEKAQKMTKNQLLKHTYCLATKAFEEYAKATQKIKKHPMGRIKILRKISPREQKLFRLLLKYLSPPSLFQHLNKDRWEVISEKRRQAIFGVLRSVYGIDDKNGKDGADDVESTHEWKRDFESRYKELANLERIEEKLLHPKRFRIVDCLKHLYASVDYVGFCKTETDYKHVEREIESLENLAAKLEDIYSEAYYAAFIKLKEMHPEIKIEDATSPTTADEEMAAQITEKQGIAFKIQSEMQKYLDNANRQKSVRDTKKTLDAWDSLTKEQRIQISLVLSEYNNNAAPPLKDGVLGENYNNLLSPWKDAKRWGLNPRPLNIFFEDPYIILLKSRIKKIHASIAHMDLDLFSVVEAIEKRRERLEKKAHELYEYIKKIEDMEKQEDENAIKKAEQWDKKWRIKKYTILLRGKHSSGSCNDS